MDSGASIHMLSKANFTPEEQETITVSKNPHNSYEGQSQSVLENGDQELPTTKLFLYRTDHLKQAEVRLRVTQCGKRHRTIEYETWLNGQRNSRQAWWTEIQNHLEVIQNILQILLRSHCPSTEKGGKRKPFTHFPKDPNCEICRRTKIARALCMRNPQNQDGNLPRGTKIQITTSSMKKGSRGCNTMLLWYKIWPLNGSTQRKTKNSQETMKSFESSLMNPKKTQT